MMRLGFCLVTAILVGCAARPAGSEEPHKVKVDGSNVVAVQQAGYKLVNKDGEKLYCRTDFVTGSHVVTRTTCLTEQELYDQMNANQHSMQSFSSKTPGPASR
jgi:hypothetical protein